MRREEGRNREKRVTQVHQYFVLSNVWQVSWLLIGNIHRTQLTQSMINGKRHSWHDAIMFIWSICRRFCVFTVESIVWLWLFDSMDEGNCRCTYSNIFWPLIGLCQISRLMSRHYVYNVMYNTRFGFVPIVLANIELLLSCNACWSTILTKLDRNASN